MHIQNFQWQRIITICEQSLFAAELKAVEASLKNMDWKETHGIAWNPRIGRILSANKQILPKKLADPPPVSSTAGSRTMPHICNYLKRASPSA